MKRLISMLRRSTPGNGHPLAHMTWASGSLTRSMSRTGLFLRKQFWLWPIIALVLLATLGFGLKLVIETTMKNRLRADLQTLLNVEVEMLRTWFRVQESHAEVLANSQKVRETVQALIHHADLQSVAAADPAAVTSETDSPNSTEPGTRPLSAPATTEVSSTALQATLRRELTPALNSYDYVGYLVVDRGHQVQASSSSELIGQVAPREYEDFLQRVFDGTTTVCPPFPSRSLMLDENGEPRSGMPTMFVCAPVRDADFQVIAALCLRIQPEREFTRLLQLGTNGETGETYAFDKRGLLVSNSRFDHDLILLGLLPDTEHARSILNISLRDPQNDMTQGYRPTIRRSEMPLTTMAAAAIAGTSGVELDDARDYRGVAVVGAWTWLPEYDIGVITKVDAAEAYRPLTILRTTFFGMFALLIGCSIAIFIFTVQVAKAEREARASAIEARQLGQYTLDQKLGAGAMGVVYRGHHAMLRRPTAVKLLDVDKVTDDTIQRFEREVQITCQLNHPNTIAIYDYGRTPEGVFYYAMEYLDGITLQTLVECYGPQPEGRVIRILTQICGSLYEAHSMGLVHRDIKPANIMLNRRGGEADVVKILDFGLVKALDDAKQSALTGANAMAGTPLYMSPEAIQTPGLVDARSDLYAVGAVGYFLLTGRTVFEADSLVQLCQAHVSETPIPPSERTGRPVSPELESAIMACLDKNRARRPQTARDIALLIARSAQAGTWSIEDAELWWGRHDRGRAPGATSSGITQKAPPATSGTPSATQLSRSSTAAQSYDQTVLGNPGTPGTIG